MSRRGFTLIEVLIALVILSLGQFAAVSVITQSTSTKIALREKTVAHWVALNVLSDYRHRHSLPPPAVSGDADMANQSFHYELTLSETGFKNLWMMSVKVMRADSPTVLDRVDGFVNQSQLNPTPVTIAWDAQATQSINTQAPLTTTVPNVGTGALFSDPQNSTPSSTPDANSSSDPNASPPPTPRGSSPPQAPLLNPPPGTPP